MGHTQWAPFGGIGLAANASAHPWILAVNRRTSGGPERSRESRDFRASRIGQGGAQGRNTAPDLGQVSEPHHRNEGIGMSYDEWIGPDGYATHVWRDLYTMKMREVAQIISRTSGQGVRIVADYIRLTNRGLLVDAYAFIPTPHRQNAEWFGKGLWRVQDHQTDELWLSDDLTVDSPAERIAAWIIETSRAITPL